MKEQLNEAPAENFSQGLLSVEIPELGSKVEGKVRDIWIVGDRRVMVTTDRQSAFDRLICTVPSKGQSLNLTSAFWFEKTRWIIPNHLKAVPHPNVLISKQAEETIPVEVVLRRYMAKSSTKTSIFYNYYHLGRRRIYGIDFPDDLKANEEFPMGTVLTPTTKTKNGHDEELTDEQTQEIVDSKCGKDTWSKVKSKAHSLFVFAYYYHLRCGLILVDTKFEFGIDKNENLMLIDEVFTPDSSRIWLAETYQQRFLSGKDPETYDKEILRRWLASNGFTGDGFVPRVPFDVINQMSIAYKKPYEIVTEKSLPDKDSKSTEIRDTILSFLS